MRTRHMCITALLMLLCSCGKDLDSGEMKVNESGRFICTSPINLSLDVETRSNDIMAECESDDITLSICEEEWGGPQISTRANVTGNEVAWDMDHPNVALYITDTYNNLLKGNIPYNAENHNIYMKYHSTNGKGGEDLNFYEGNVQNVDSKSEFFWLTESWAWQYKPDKMPDKVNFYGYYPRAADGGTVSDNLHYDPTSVIDRTSANEKDGWNILDFVFYSAQTKENLSHHDVMYSIPETGTEEEVAHRAGNQGKTKNDNIQLHFVHAFCLFEVSITNGANYNGKGNVASITLEGDEIYNSGEINIGMLSGSQNRIEPGTKKQSIVRRITPGENVTPGTFKTTMIVPPCTVAKGKKEDMKIKCRIDGGDYSCSIFSDTRDLVFEGGKKYYINLTLEPDGVVIVNAWDGASITINGETYKKEAVLPLEFGTYSYTCSPNAGYEICAVLCDGQQVNEIVKEEGKNKIYNVVALPSNGWYATAGDEPYKYHDLRIHFDAIQHDKCYNSENMSESPNPYVWSDLSGHGNDGILQGFDENSGWRKDGDKTGLFFDGINDLVKYPGTLNTKEYTMSFVVEVDEAQVEGKMHYRLNAEGIDYPSFYITSGTEALSLYGHGVDHDLCVPGYDGIHIYKALGKRKQYDFVYNEDGNGKIKVYVNGSLQNNKDFKETLKEPKEIVEASLGGRTQDNSRSLKGKFFSFMLYDRALRDDEILINWNLNNKRYATMTPSGTP